MEERGQIHASLALHIGKDNFVIVELKSGGGGHQSRSPRFEEGKQSHTPAGNRTMILGFSTGA